MEGDARNKADTMAIRLGVKKTVKLVTALLYSLVFYLVYLMAYGDYSIYFSVLILSAVLPVIVYVLISLKKELPSVNFEKLSLIMKIDMFFGIMAFYAGMFEDSDMSANPTSS
jgi:geranylgeranylglycerol-phosphate geranylgeranyltransferase